MSTRAAIRFKPGPDAPAEVTLLVHYDGYPEYLGVKLARAVALSTQAQALNILHVLDHLRPVNFRIGGPLAGDEEYLYDVHPADTNVQISIFDLNNDQEIFTGTVEELLAKYKK